MDLVEFRLSLAADGPPQEASALLQALWHDARSNWNHAHALVQSQRGPQAAAIHAYLHRKEGDVANADYWYARAGAARTGMDLQVEWRLLVESLLGADVPSSPSDKARKGRGSDKTDANG